MDSNKTFDEVMDELVANNRKVENLVRVGREKLAAKRLVDEQRAAVMEEAVQKRRAETLENFRVGLAGLIGQEALGLIEFGYEDVCQTPTELRIFVSGHPVVFSVYHLSTGESVRFSSEEPFAVAGMYCVAPVIDDGEVFEGCVEWTYANGRNDGHPLLRFADLEMALALADERGQLAQVLRARYAERAAELNLELGKAKMKAVYELGAVKGRAIQDEELVYEPVDEPGLNPLVNMDEVVRLVRGVVLEVLEERGL